MSKFMQGIAGTKNKTVSPQEVDDIAEKLHAKLEATPSVSVTKTVTKPKVVTKPIIVTDKEEPKKSTRPVDTHRLTLDIPNELIEQMKKDTKRSGQTIKGFIVSLIYDFYENKE